MEKKSIITIDGFSGNKHQFYLSGSEKPNPKNYFNFLLPKQIKMIKNQFDNFYNRLLRYCLEGEEEEMLTKYRGSFEATFYSRAQLMLALYRMPQNGKKTNKNKSLIPDFVIDKVIRDIFFWADLSILMLMNHPANLKVLYKHFVETANELQIKNFELGRYGNLDKSDPLEQELFKAVWEINKDCDKNNVKFSPFYNFKKVNDKEKYVSNDLIQQVKFSLTPLYNRYRQFRKREQKIKFK
jgi:hypothetical protein